MDVATHTPGPWRVIIDDDGNPLSGRPGVFAADEYDCAIVHWDGFVQEHWRSARGDKEIHANARLIAAAPDLLSALEGLVRYAEAVRMTAGMGKSQLARLEAAKAAIALATPPKGSRHDG